MAKGHQAVVRRSLNLPEWIRVRLAEVAHWRELASAAVTGWQIRPAAYHGPGRYEWLGRWRPVRPGDLWGEPDGTFFLRAAVRVPAAFRGLPVLLELLTPTEMLVRAGGRLVGAIDPNRSEVRLLARARGGERMAVQVEATMRSAPDDNRTGQRLGEGHGCVQTWRDPRIVSFDPVYEEFLLDYQVALDVAACPAVESEVCAYLYHHLDAALKRLDRDTRDRRAFHRSAAAAGAYLRRHVYAAEGLSAPGRLALVAHSHMDVAYHWRVKQGIRKNARTTLVQLGLMDEYPEFTYCHTQPFLYETLKAHYPDLYRRVKAKVRRGQWELAGGLYVEPDGNVPSGESLIRQCLVGKRFFLREFGIDVDTCWLPDVFGNSWIMPQILAKAGIRYFVSNKMSTWNDTNAFPHTNFLWKGVDGSIVAACVPASHFISWLAPDQLLANWEGFKEKLTVGESMNMYGFGDGGGGVTREMLQVARRIRAFPGLPRTRQVTARQYLDEAFRSPEQLAVWDDELYLEMHRGTSTTKGLLKKLNRRCELVAREAELFTVLAAPFGLRPPRARLERAWKQVLVNQFHDILPGSHTTPVGREAEDTYREALAAFEAVRGKALAALAARVATDAQPGRPLVVFNSLNWPRGGPVKVPLAAGAAAPAALVDSAGRPVPCQAIAERDGRRMLLADVPDVPGVGCEVLYAADKALATGQTAATATSLRATTRLLENRFFRLRFDARGEITSLFDKRAGRGVLAPGEQGNVFQLFEDKPGVYDAWDIVAQYREKAWDISAVERLQVVERGPVRAALRLEKRFFASRLVQTISVYDRLPRIDFETWVDWREHNRLLKVCFPVRVLARRATYDLSYGSIQRPTSRNTSWEQARFEVCGHQWADLSEAGYGVSLLNDCKYGHDIEGHRMRLSLLRGPIRPDPDSDQGEHEFTYSLFPHAGSWQEGGTVREAQALNSPLLAVPAARRGARPFRRAPRRKGGPGPVAPGRPMVSVEGEGVFLGALKPAEDGGGFIVRLVEVHGGRPRATVRFAGGARRKGRAPAGRGGPAARVRAVRETDLLERPLPAAGRPPEGAGPPAIRGTGFTTRLAPFEIKTFLVTLGH